MMSRMKSRVVSGTLLLLFFSINAIFVHRLSDASGKMTMKEEKRGKIVKKDLDPKVTEVTDKGEYIMIIK